MTQRYWTDYPFVELGDIPFKEAPIREVQVISYDYDKYVIIEVEGIITAIKSGYIYKESGRHGAVPTITREELHLLPETEYLKR